MAVVGGGWGHGLRETFWIFFCVPAQEKRGGMKGTLSLGVALGDRTVTLVGMQEKSVGMGETVTPCVKVDVANIML